MSKNSVRTLWFLAEERSNQSPDHAGSGGGSLPAETAGRSRLRESEQSVEPPGDELPMTETVLSTRTAIRINPKLPRAVRLDVLEASTHVAGKATQLLIGIWLLVVIRQSPTVPLSRRTMARVGVSRYCATDALRRLEGAGLVKVWRLPGRSPRVTLVEPGTGTPLKLTAA